MGEATSSTVCRRGRGSGPVGSWPEQSWEAGLVLSLFAYSMHDDHVVDGILTRSRRIGDVPVPEITRRWSAAQKNLAETAASLGTIDVLDNSHGVTRHVASITKGGIRFPATPTPAWAWALIRQIEQHRPAT